MHGTFACFYLYCWSCAAASDLVVYDALQPQREPAINNFCLQVGVVCFGPNVQTIVTPTPKGSDTSGEWYRYDWDDASSRLYAAALTIKLSISCYMHMTHLYTYGAHSKSIQFDLNGSGLDDQVDQFCTTLGHCTTVAPHRHVLFYTSGLAWLATITWECCERCHSGIHSTHTHIWYIYIYIYIYVYLKFIYMMIYAYVYTRAWGHWRFRSIFHTCLGVLRSG